MLGRKKLAEQTRGRRRMHLVTTVALRTELALMVLPSPPLPTHVAPANIYQSSRRSRTKRS